TVKEEEKAWLTVVNKPLLALYLSETSGKAHGGVLIAPQVTQYPSSRGIINSLRHTLADHHWHTLTLDLTSTIHSDGSMDEDRAQKAITAGIKYLNQQGVYNIAILGEGIGAAHALHFVATLPEASKNSSEIQQIRALIMINAQNKIPNSTTNTLKAFEKVKLPILDAYSGSDFHSQQQAKQRKNAGRHLNRFHQQVRLPQTALFQTGYENRITKRIRGWLDKNVAGFMVQEQISR
ncbi:MAG: DUF3530 family protein, partial [Spongiibacteraceae bacterium]|nr:DUF3530 family protein [Spongiibacteraceae bacterium]